MAAKFGLMGDWDKSFAKDGRVIGAVFIPPCQPSCQKRFMRRISGGFRSGKDEEQKQKQYYECLNQMRREQICSTCHAAWKLGHICGESIGKDLSLPSDVRCTKANGVDCKEEMVMAKDLDQQVEDIVGESMVGTTTHEDDKSKQE